MEAKGRLSRLLRCWRSQLGILLTQAAMHTSIDTSHCGPWQKLLSSVLAPCELLWNWNDLCVDSLNQTVGRPLSAITMPSVICLGIHESNDVLYIEIQESRQVNGGVGSALCLKYVADE